MDRPIVIIPSYKPTETLVKLTEELAAEFSLLVVDDGGGEEYRSYFERVAALGATVLTHKVNRGKGAALKTAISHLIDKGGEWLAVTADSDGQHSAKDIRAVAKLTKEKPESLVLGVRDVNAMPLRSRFGNKMTRGAFHLVTRTHVTDTQTGLRGFTHLTAERLLGVRGDRYEYEMNVLLDAKSLGIPFEEIIIDTIYIDGNVSHFHPIRDSYMVFSQVIKHILASVICTAFDYMLYLAMLAWLPILPASAAYLIARGISVILNYQLSKRMVFKGARSDWRTTVAYFMLALCMASTGSMLIMIGTDYLGWNEGITKLPVDVVLFFVNFVVQKHVIFK
ncbi:MAG: bifunctional glycosyltransferase family 2/GtrA family protein [Clostridia bacterium]|nr:bifunctional glycosyltransferase family 2/GtrA family protein [Clostridia bacterium]